MKESKKIQVFSLNQSRGLVIFEGKSGRRPPFMLNFEFMVENGPHNDDGLEKSLDGRIYCGKKRILSNVEGS